MKAGLGLVSLLAVLALPLPALAQHDATHETLGRVSFPTSCDPKVQAEFERGVAMLHSYWFGTAGRTFRAVLEQDPGCAMAYWGIAVDLLGNTLSGPPSQKDAQAAWEALEKARGARAPTDRERGWIDALRAYYRGHDSIPLATRLRSYNAAMAQLVARYPDDFEAQVFYALTLQASAPTSDLTYANQLESAAMLEKLYAQNPRHPGVTHFIIHAYDYAPLAQDGVAAARRYAGIAPAVPHARHMPSHIYSMVGLWEDSIASNLSSLEIQPDYYHAADFTVYAHLQLGQDARADAMIRKALNTPPRGDRPPSLGNFTALAAMPARYALERADWAGAAALPVSAGSGQPQADAVTRFARGLGMARSGNAAGAKREIGALQELRRALQESGQTYWVERMDEQILAVSAWVAHAEGARDQAAALMRRAADGEDGSVKHVAMENRLYPMRELLGDLLLEMGQARPALQEYAAALKTTPNRFRGLNGAALAALAAGDEQSAADYFTRLLALSKNADGTRPEIARAKAFLSR